MSNETEIKNLGAFLYEQHETQDDDVKFILQTIGAPAKKVLEVACGGGRILVPLAKAGHDAWGFDMDDDMLANIPAKALGLSNIHWCNADALLDDWGAGFDVVVLAGNLLFNIEIGAGIEYKKAQELFIQKAANALVTGGYLYIGYNPWAPNGRTLTRPAGYNVEDDGNVVWEWEGTDEHGNYQREWTTSGAFDEDSGILTSTNGCEQRLADGTHAEEITFGIKHYATLEHIHGWLTAAGFEIEQQYENFDKKPIDDDSTTLIIYARKK
ncbi:MAG: class I SAM-dependent methyltransferase [Defluviitaleaceae bacterium]|nr:class I SAM-dependent methyltransferase [Defluviitaleaceae bacterium]